MASQDSASIIAMYQDLFAYERRFRTLVEAETHNINSFRDRIARLEAQLSDQTARREAHEKMIRTQQQQITTLRAELDSRWVVGQGSLNEVGAKPQHENNSNDAAHAKLERVDNPATDDFLSDGLLVSVDERGGESHGGICLDPIARWCSQN